MTAYALLLRLATNRLYSKGAAALNTAELSVLTERVFNGSLQGVEPTVIGGVDYVRFEADGTLSDDPGAHLGKLSSAYALFEVADDTRPVPVTLPAVPHTRAELAPI